MSKYNSRHQYMTENMVDWLKDFADKQAEKIASENEITPQDMKNANYMENILDIVNRKKKMSVESKVQHYRELVGLDMIDNLEKEGGREVTASATRIVLSFREKTADKDEQMMEKIRQYVFDVVRNRNGAIATPAILDQIEHYMQLDKEWLRERQDVILGDIEKAKAEFQPHNYNDIQAEQLARTDEPSRGEKEQPLFLPPATSG